MFYGRILKVNLSKRCIVNLCNTGSNYFRILNGENWEKNMKVQIYIWEIVNYIVADQPVWTVGVYWKIPVTLETSE